MAWDGQGPAQCALWMGFGCAPSRGREGESAGFGDGRWHREDAVEGPAAMQGGEKKQVERILDG